MNSGSSNLFRTIDTHFKTEKWDLRYQLYLEMSKLKHEDFCIALIKNGYQIFYCEDKDGLFFNKGKKNAKSNFRI